MTDTRALTVVSDAKPGDLLGFTDDGFPIRLLAGGAFQDDADDDGDSEDEGENDDTDDGDDGDKDGADKDKGKKYTPPSEEEWNRVRTTAQKRKEEKKTLQRELAEAKAKLNGDGKGGKDGKPDEETATKLKDDATKARDGYWKPLYVKQAAKAALLDAGLQGKPERLLKLLDMDEIEVDEDGDLDGLDDQIADLKKDYPDFFVKKTPGSIDANNKDKGNGKKTSRTAQLLKSAKR